MSLILTFAICGLLAEFVNRSATPRRAVAAGLVGAVMGLSTIIMLTLPYVIFIVASKVTAAQLSTALVSGSLGGLLCHAMRKSNSI